MGFSAALCPRASLSVSNLSISACRDAPLGPPGCSRWDPLLDGQIGKLRTLRFSLALQVFLFSQGLCRERGDPRLGRLGAKFLLPGGNSMMVVDACRPRFVWTTKAHVKMLQRKSWCCDGMRRDESCGRTKEIRADPRRQASRRDASSFNRSLQDLT